MRNARKRALYILAELAGAAIAAMAVLAIWRA